MQLLPGLLRLLLPLPLHQLASDELNNPPPPGAHLADLELDATPGLGASSSSTHTHLDPQGQQHHLLLLLATLLVVAALYPLKLLISWLGGAKVTTKGTRGQQHRHQTQPPQHRHHRGSSTQQAAAAHGADRDQQGQAQDGSFTFSFLPAAPRTGMTRSRTPQTDRPFRFRNPDLDPPAPAGASAADASLGAPRSAPSFRVSKRRQSQGGAAPTPPADGHVQQQQQQQEVAAGGWDPELLQRCAANQAFISSEEALQRSPLFVDHIRSVRGRQLNYERSENHKLRVYKALREVDPSSFQRLFSRTDIKEYDEVKPPRWQVLLDGLVSAATTWACLALPHAVGGAAASSGGASASSSSHWQLGALAWLLLTLWAVSGGCTSVTAWLFSTHATCGPYAALAPTPRLLAAVAAEAALVALLPGGWGVPLALLWRLCSEERQGCGEWLLRITPLREVVGPVPFSPLPPASSTRGGGLGHTRGGGAGGSVALQARLFDEDNDD